MARKILAFFLLLATLVLCSNTSRANGYSNVRNFLKSEYGGGTQNWDVVQDDCGRMYFGNRDGMLVLDGSRWRKYYLPNYTTVRALLYDSADGRIYAAGSDEFGYFASDEATGELRYFSLLGFLPKNRPKFTEIWHIYKDGTNIWFQTDYQLLCLSDNYINVYPVDGRISTSAQIGSDIYAGLDDGRLLQLYGGRFKELDANRTLMGKRIVSIQPYSDSGGLLIGTSVDGLYRYDGRKVERFDCPVNDFLSSNQLFCVERANDTYIFGTVNSGAVIYNIKTGDVRYVNKETGLQNNTVLNAGFDAAHNLWLCLDNGIDYVILNSPLTNLLGRNNNIGAGYASFLSGNRMFLGTNQGLYLMTYPRAASPLPPVPEQKLQGQIWSISNSPHGVFIASDAGIYVYDNMRFSRIDNVHGAYKVAMLPGSDDAAIASTYDSFRIIRWRDGSWHDGGAVGGYNDITGDFVLDNDGTLWMPHWRKGIYRLRYDQRTGTFYDTRLYDISDGFPSNENNTVGLLDDDVIFSTQSGFYRFKDNNVSDGPVIVDTVLNDVLGDEPAGEFDAMNGGSLVFVNSNGVFVITRRNDDGIMVNRTSLGSANKEIIPGYVHLNILSPDEMIISTQDGFSCINTGRDFSEPSPEPFVCAVYANRDSLIYQTSLKANEVRQPELPIILNSLRFEFAYPVFDYADRAEFSSYLENYEKEWSPYSTEPYREYTRLDEGDYTMHLRVRDTKTGEVKTASFGFSIQPPWFRSTWAKIIYLLLAIFFLYGIYLLAKNRLAHVRLQTEHRKDSEMQALRLQTEQESVIKDSEIASLKSEQHEQDVRHKLQELSNTTTNLIRLNEVLNDIAGQIEKIQGIANAENPRSSVIRPLSRIKEKIDRILNDDKDSKTFYKNFDIVYGDYTERLMEMFPSLTTSEKRLCCFIRMGLTSKEIAPLINISYKSVEMARYRLRKKLNIPAETTLTDFLLSI